MAFGYKYVMLMHVTTKKVRRLGKRGILNSWRRLVIHVISIATEAIE